MINRKKFFATVRPLHGGKLTVSQVEGYNFILDVWEQGYDNNPLSFLAYALATVHKECGGTVQPIRERGGTKYLSKYDTGKLAAALGNTPAADGDGIKYAGRGYVQLTGAANYKKVLAKLGIDAVKNPDLALNPHIAAQVMFAGMTQGWFTGKRLADYNLKTGFQKVNARRIINGLDCAVEIAGFYDVYVKALAK
ncbi:hypothetical protein [Phyllobacterium endophyticum]|uniref:hypothetical protein n=1 Tax=Phyllobacterium endophyticum TaxID=1149773 RepID=UPI0011CC732A|nr:hypothetical protein [Phyllobacterium endophyticum]TXR49911.1 hypothetical protein FVA77_07815 [Phyllobacterium endophyticum]